MQAGLRKGAQLPSTLVTNSVRFVCCFLVGASNECVQSKRKARKDSSIENTIEQMAAAVCAVANALQSPSRQLLAQKSHQARCRRRDWPKGLHRGERMAAVPGSQDRDASQQSNVLITMLALTAHSRRLRPLMRSPTFSERKKVGSFNILKRHLCRPESAMRGLVRYVSQQSGMV